MPDDRFDRLLRSASRLLVAGVSGLLLSASASMALVPAGGSGPNPRPIPPNAGPTLPYIAGRLARSAPTVTPPAGAVVPDEFCIPGKLNDCGDHLRNQKTTFPGIADTGAAQEPKTTYFGDPGKAFAESRNSVWTGVQSRRTTLQGPSQVTDTRNVLLGADHRFGNDVVLGLMAMGTNVTDTLSASSIVDKSDGVLVGPYFALNLSENWTLDGRFLSGRLSHGVDTAGVPTAAYNSSQMSGSLRVAGDLDRGNWRLTPSLELSTLRHSDEAYVDGIRGPIPASSSAQTYLTGVILGYYNGVEASSGGLTPYGGLEISQELGSASPFGTARLGIAYDLANGGLLTVDYAYGAIGLATSTDQMLSVNFELPF